MITTESIRLIECPRDAMQGLQSFIPTALKIEYLNLLLQVGFDTLDFGSFVSAKAVPQMADTVQVLEGLDLDGTQTRLLAIVANVKGITEAAQYPNIAFLGYPFSISETFQRRNTNTGMESSLSRVNDLLEHCEKRNKSAVVYLSMAFGNPYGDDWSEELAAFWAEKLHRLGVQTLALSDTTGLASPELVSSLYSAVRSTIPEATIGVHLHSTVETTESKIAAAYYAGCRRFDSALRGFGGCPMASDKLTGNIATENLISFLSEKRETLNLNMIKFQEALSLSTSLFAADR